MKISIIIPVYNTEKHLEKCLNSILNNDFINYEILIVNDGSTDKSKNISEKYVKKDKRIKLYNLEHKGVSNARNFGIENAKGKYIAFIDSDDTIEKNYLSSLYDYAKKFDLDWAYCDFKINYIEKNLCESVNFFNKTFYIKGEKTKIFVSKSVFISNFNNYYSLTSSCMSIFKRKILIENNVRFNINVNYGEDMCFNYEFTHFINSFGYVKKNLYNVIKHNDNPSLSDQFSIKNRILQLNKSQNLFESLENIKNKYNDELFFEYKLYFFIYFKKIVFDRFSIILDNKIKYYKYFKNFQKSKSINNLINSLEIDKKYTKNKLDLLFLLSLKTKSVFIMFFMCNFIKLIRVFFKK